ncbi:MAG: hypothetical protein U0271_09755 [Polyangiaceae bacterium]
MKDKALALFAGVLGIVAVGCGNGAGGASSSAATTGTGANKTAASSTSSSAAASASAPATATEKPAAAPGTTAELRANAQAIMGALKRGDAKAAGAYCKGKHHDAFEKYLAENIEKKSREWDKWDEKLGEIRVDGDNARVAYKQSDKDVGYLSFRKIDGSWSLDDTPSTSKASWDKWGKVATD